MVTKIEIFNKQQVLKVLEALGIKPWTKYGMVRYYIPPRFYYIVVHPNITLVRKALTANDCWNLVQQLDGTYVDAATGRWVAPATISTAARELLIRLDERCAELCDKPEEIAKIRQRWERRKEKAQTAAADASEAA